MSEHNPFGDMHATTIITVRKDGQVVMARFRSARR